MDSNEPSSIAEDALSCLCEDTDEGGVRSNLTRTAELLYCGMRIADQYQWVVEWWV